MFRITTLKLIVLLAGVIAAATAGMWCFLQGHVFYAILCMLAAIVLVGSIVRLFRSGTRKISFLFNAIENGDYSFRFTSSDPKDRFNLMLNYIKELLVKARDEVMEKERYYERILNHVDTGIVVLNEKGNIYQVNKRALELLRLSVLTHVNQLQRTSDRLPDLFAALETGESRSIRINTNDGDIYLSFQASEMTLHDKKFRIIAINDIEHEIDENEIESWINLTRVLTHEIMNSITPITSLSDTLLHIHGSREDDLGRGLETIHGTTKSLTSFVSSYRKFTHIAAPCRTLFYLRPFLEKILLLFSRELENKGISSRIELSPDDLILHADENQISQVLVNLLKNGIAAIGKREAGRIWFRAYCDEAENILIEIGNNGEPIPAPIAEQMFIPFFTTKTDGSGIGLSISRRIMRMHDGSIKLKHSNERETIFLLTFK